MPIFSSKGDVVSKFIFVTGATGSGKSTVCDEIEQIVGRLGLTVATLSLDHYYLPKSELDPSKPKNFDIPEALEQKLITEHLTMLESGKTIARPTYDMTISDRVSGGEVEFLACDVIIVEGIFAAEYKLGLLRDTERLSIYLQSQQLNDNYTRKADRDRLVRRKTPEHIKAMRLNQIQCFFSFVAHHMTSSDIVIDNTWQPSVGSSVGDGASSSSCDSISHTRVPMIIGDKLERLMDFLSPKVTSSLAY
ncbi:hypothetical protein LEWO105114_02535 [Legionella worsleiensis]|uniref:Uridine kinase n=1 Tax=Legionella worsleiensis TaxID=45076 RepID=A0A0W1A5R7_9GAMM|nr:uridine kinase [Legionella worsleiensis]STY30499.1 uridine kinase [Legionella worsleiensis]